MKGLSEGARERAERRAFWNAGGAGGIKWATTMRSVLKGDTEQRADDLSNKGTARFDGIWYSRQDGEPRGFVDNCRLTWDEDGTVTRLSVLGERGDVICMTVDGHAYSGVLNDAGLLKWSDGDVWIRGDHLGERIAKHLSDGSIEAMVVEEEVGWGRWVRAQRPESQRGPWRPLTSSTYSSYFESPMPTWGL